MACCKPCCGCQNCAEGQEGKCCCGGAEGACCQAGEYCCSGVCQNSPCDGGGACCLPATCTVEADVDFTGTEYEGGPFPTPDGWTQMGALLPDEFPNIIHYIHVIPGTEPCDDQSQYYADLLTAFAAWQDALGLPVGSFAFSSVTQNPASCADDLSQASCEEQGGTYHAGQTCADNPCVGACCLPSGECTDGVTEAACGEGIPRCYCGYYVGAATEDPPGSENFVCPDGQDVVNIFECWEQFSVPVCADGTCECPDTCPGNPTSSGGPFFTPSGTYHPGAVCADDPCNPLP